jgi:uncharacterized protein
MPSFNISPSTARRMAIMAQRLAGPMPAANNPETILELLRQIRCLQLDPIQAVDRTQYLVLWSRLGQYDREDLARLAYEDKALFEYWAHAASLVLTEDYPLHEAMMRRYGGGEGGSAWSQRVIEWVKVNEPLRQGILADLAENGAKLTQELVHEVVVPWESGGWNNGRGVSYMLDHLWTAGEIMVARRKGLKRWWDLTERVLPPEFLGQGGWSSTAVTRTAIPLALNALGVGRASDIKQHFIEGRYAQLEEVLTEMVSTGEVITGTVEGLPTTEPWYIHRDSLPLLADIEAGAWQARTTLLSPFDNLIRNRERTELLWNFYYRIEIYVPVAKRQYGYYVLPILHGEHLVGRVDSRMDRKRGVYEVIKVFWEDGVVVDEGLHTAVSHTLHNLARFLGAKEVMGV